MKYGIASIVFVCCIIGFFAFRRGRKNKEGQTRTPYENWMSNEEAKSKGIVKPQFKGPAPKHVNPDGQKIEDLHLVFEEDVADIYGGGANEQEYPSPAYEENGEPNYDDLYGADTSVPIYDDQQGYADESNYGDESGYDNEQNDETYAGEYDINGQSTHNPVYNSEDLFDDQIVGVNSTASVEPPRLDASRGSIRKASLFNLNRFKGTTDPMRLAHKASVAETETQSTLDNTEDNDGTSPKPQLPAIGGKKTLFNPIRFKAGGDVHVDQSNAVPPTPPKQLLKKNIFNPSRFKSGEDQVEDIPQPSYDKKDLNAVQGDVNDSPPPAPSRTLVGVYDKDDDRADSPTKPKTIAPLRAFSPKSPAQPPAASVVPKRPTQFKALVPASQVFKPKAAASDVAPAQEGQFPVRFKAPVAEAPVPQVRDRPVTTILNDPVNISDFNL